MSSYGKDRLFLLEQALSNANIQPISKRPLLFDALNHRLAFALFLYLLILLFLFPYAGRDVGALAVLPVALAATYYGAARGAIAGLLSLPFNGITFLLLEPATTLATVLEPSAVVGTVAVIGVGYGVGSISELGKRLQHEVKEREHATTALELANVDLESQAQKSAEARNYFLTAVSHELRTPLNAVLGASILLLDTSVTEDQKELTETVLKGGQDTVQIINTILDFTKVESGAMRLNNSDFEVLTCLDKVINNQIRHASAKNIDLYYIASSDVPLHAIGDGPRLTYILNTLVRNALAFTDKGEISIQVDICDDEDKERSVLEFIVKDTGIGIQEEALESLFKPFERSVATSQTYHAIGIGLALCRSLCHLMGGHMWVESETGRGTQFHFRIAVGKSSAQATELTLLSGLAQKIVMVIGDREAIQENIASVLHRTKVITIGVDSIESACEVISCGASIDLVIIANKVPYQDQTINYVDALETLFADLSIPVVLLVNTERDEPNPMAPADCVDNVLLTPIQWQQTAQVVSSALHQHHRHPKPDLKRIQWRTHAVHFDEELATRKPLRILMAEDNPVNAKVATRILERLGYKIDRVANGADAITAVQQKQYDVILMDIQMPVMDGIEATKAIRQLGSDFVQPYIIALTADTTLEEQTQYEAYGLDHYTGKPISVDVLHSALERAWDARSGQKIQKSNPITFISS